MKLDVVKQDAVGTVYITSTLFYSFLLVGIRNLKLGIKSLKASKMSGFVRADALGYLRGTLPPPEQISINDQNCPQAALKAANNGFEFELTFGECGMSVSQEDNSIIFETILRLFYCSKPESSEKRPLVTRKRPCDVKYSPSRFL